MKESKVDPLTLLSEHLVARLYKDKMMTSPTQSGYDVEASDGRVSR